MNHSKRAELFRQLRTKYAGFLASVLWKLTGDRELFTEAMQYALLGMWEHVEKLNGKKAGAYIYRIVLTANSKAWRDRIGRNGHFNKDQLDFQENLSFRCPNRPGGSCCAKKFEENCLLFVLN